MNEYISDATQALANAKKYGATSGEYDPATRKIVETANRNTAKKEAHQYHKTLVGSTETERYDRLKKLKEMDSRAIELEPLFESPVQMLSRVALGSQERSRYQEQLTGAGPRELMNHANWAMAHGSQLEVVWFEGNAISLLGVDRGGNRVRQLSGTDSKGGKKPPF